MGNNLCAPRTRVPNKGIASTKPNDLVDTKYAKKAINTIPIASIANLGAWLAT